MGANKTRYKVNAEVTSVCMSKDEKKWLLMEYS